jgi:hypothetical protein
MSYFIGIGQKVFYCTWNTILYKHNEKKKKEKFLLRFLILTVVFFQCGRHDIPRQGLKIKYASTEVI